MGILGHLLCTKSRESEGHYYLQIVGGHRLVSILDTNKGWRERFLFVFGADSIIACSTWPEIKNEALRVGLLLEVERFGLEKIRAYTGSRNSKNLFDTDVLSTASLSHVPATEVNVAWATLLSLELDERLRRPQRQAPKSAHALSLRGRRYWLFTGGRPRLPSA